MSQDNPVTRVTQSSVPDVLWSQRLLSLSGIRLLRMRTIERSYGRLERCGCQKQTRFPAPQESTRLICGLLAAEPQGRVRQTTECRLHETGWLVFQPETAGYLWAEIVEITNVSKIFADFQTDSEPSEIRNLEAWEQLGRSEVSFRVCPLEDFHSQSFSCRLRTAVVRDILQRNPKFSHVNLMILDELHQQDDRLGLNEFAAAGLFVERLRDRILPSWQSGDMAIRKFTAYTITRKDT